MCSDIAIKVENLSKCYQIYNKPHDRLLQMLARGQKQYYREFWALKNVSFEIKKGETVGIIGRNGSGKSTLLQMICGTLNPTSGSVQTNGRIAALLELGSGFNVEFTGRENVYMNASLYGLSRAQIDQRFNEIAAFADIGDFVEQPVKLYSSGMFVRLAFAVIAHVDADILVIDEALSVGDALFSRKCTQFLRKFMEKGTVLFVSHDTASVKSLCHRAFWINSGQIVADGDTKSVSDAYLQYLYESQQGKSTASLVLKPASTEQTQTNDDPPSRRDMRLDFINSTNLRNDIQVFEMTATAQVFGKGGVSLSKVELADENKNPLSWVVGGETVNLYVEGIAHQPLSQVVVGFVLKDRLGQYLFGDNTHLSTISRPFSVSHGEAFSACFQFMMPILRSGDYGFDIAVADGTQADHIQQIWVTDALSLKSVSSSVCTGLVGIPMQSIKLEIL